MKAKVRLAMVAIILAPLGCGSRSTLPANDGSAKRDGAPGADLLTVADTFEVAASGPDLAVSPDVQPRAETSPDLPSDPASPDIASERPCSRCDAPARDEPASDVPALADSSVADTAPESASPDLGSSEAAPDLAGDAMFSSIDSVGASFCTGDLSHMVVNGIESHPAVTARTIALDCCDAGELALNTATFVYPIVVAWRAQVGATSQFPATVDLASLPTGWSIQVIAGCQSSMSSCNPPPDRYTAGLEGVLQVSRASPGYNAGLCLHVQEPTASPHPIVHTLDLYVPQAKLN